MQEKQQNKFERGCDTSARAISVMTSLTQPQLSLHCAFTFAINVLLPISSMAGDYQGTDLVFLVLWAFLVGERKARGVGCQKPAGVWPVGPPVLYLAAKKKKDTEPRRVRSYMHHIPQ